MRFSCLPILGKWFAAEAPMNLRCVQVGERKDRWIKRYSTSKVSLFPPGAVLKYYRDKLLKFLWVSLQVLNLNLMATIIFKKKRGNSKFTTDFITSLLSNLISQEISRCHFKCTTLPFPFDIELKVLVSFIVLLFCSLFACSWHVCRGGRLV